MDESRIANLCTLSRKPDDVIINPYNGASGGGFLPADLTGLKLWLSDTGSDPSAWPDLSGGGNDALQATSSQQPTIVSGAINGRQVRRFDGVDDELLSGPSIGTAMTVVIAGRTRITNYATGPISSLYGARAASQGSCAYLTNSFGSSSATYFEAEGTGGSTVSALLYANGTLVSSPYGGWPGSAVYGVATIVTTSQNAMPAGVRIGALLGSNNSTVLYGQVDLAEVIIYDRALNSTERGQVEAYLGTKYGITITP